MSDTTISGSKSKQVSITTRHTPRQSQKQRNYAITCGGIVVVLKTQVAGSLYIITGDGKRKCIEINIDDASVGKARRAGDKGTGNINVTATVRTLYVDGGPVEDEETEVKVEELQDDEETLDALSGLQRTSAATTPTPETHTAENTTQLSATNTPILPVTQTKRRIEPTSPSTPAASQPSTSHTSSSSTVAAATQTRSMRRDTKAGAAMPPTAPASPSPKKRSATEMESSDAVQGPSALVNGGSKKRVKVAEEKPPRSPPRRGRVSDFQT